MQQEANSLTTSTTSPTSTTVPTTADKAVEVLEEIGDAELLDAVLEVLDGDITPENVTELIDSGLENADPLVVAAVVEVLNEADIEVKHDFEEQTNVFSGTFDDYVPSGSNVSVAERRTIVAVTATVASPLSPVTAVRRRR